MIKCSIDVTLLDKSKFKEITRRNGDKAVFCDLILIETPQSKFGDYMVKQDSTKEEREAKVQTKILGNGKNVGKTVPHPDTPTNSGDDIVPF